MHAVCLLSLCALVFIGACSRGPDRQIAATAGGQAASASQGQAAGAPAVGKAGGTGAAAIQAPAQPLGEFEPVAAADVDLYLKVMRAAAERVKNMPQADRDALKMLRSLSTGASAGQVPTPEQMAGIQRAGELMAMDALVAREMGVETRYRSIAYRAERFIMPMDGASSGDEHEVMTEQQRRDLKVRIQKFRDLRAADAAMLQPHHDEIAALQKQVNFVMHPESVPK